MLGYKQTGVSLTTGAPFNLLPRVVRHDVIVEWIRLCTEGYSMITVPAC